MTYLEAITYHYGKFMELMSYVLKNAYRVAYLYTESQSLTPYTRNSQSLEIAEYNARLAISQNASFGSKELLSFFFDKGLSVKEYKELEETLHIRDRLLSSYFLEKSGDFAKEDVNAYESAIEELTGYVSKADKLNVSLAKSATKLYDLYR